MSKNKTYKAELHGLKDAIDDSRDAVLIEGFNYYLTVMAKRMPEYDLEIGCMHDSYADFISAVSDADSRVAEKDLDDDRKEGERLMYERSKDIGM